MGIFLASIKWCLLCCYEGKVFSAPEHDAMKTYEGAEAKLHKKFNLDNRWKSEPDSSSDYYTRRRGKTGIVCTRDCARPPIIEHAVTKKKIHTFLCWAERKKSNRRCHPARVNLPQTKTGPESWSFSTSIPNREIWRSKPGQLTDYYDPDIISLWFLIRQGKATAFLWMRVLRQGTYSGKSRRLNPRKEQSFIKLGMKLQTQNCNAICLVKNNLRSPMKRTKGEKIDKNYYKKGKT